MLNQINKDTKGGVLIRNLKKKFVMLGILFLILVLAGCSQMGSDGGNTSGELVLKDLQAVSGIELKATFSNGETKTITEFTPKPLELGEYINVKFVYDNVNYSEEVKYIIDLKGNFNTNTSYIQKILSPTCFAQTNDQIAQVILFYEDNYEVAEVTKGTFELSIDDAAPAGLIFADNNDAFVGYLNVDGLDSLPINSMSDGTGSIDLGEITFSGIEGSPNTNKDNLLNIDSTEKEMLTATDDLFSSIVRNSDLNKNGEIDILEEEPIKTAIRGKLLFYASGGSFNRDLIIDKNENIKIDSSKFLVEFYSENYSIPDPSEVIFNCADINQDINGQSDLDDSGTFTNSGSYFSNPTSGILPAGDYKVDIGSEIDHTFYVSNVLSNAEDNLIYVIPKVDLNDYGTINSIEWKFQNKKGDAIENPSNILNSLEIQLDAVDAAAAENYKNYTQGDLRIYNGYPDDINSLEHKLTEDIKWEDIGSISMAYNDVFRNHYVISFQNKIENIAKVKVDSIINAFENEDTSAMDNVLAPEFEWDLNNGEFNNTKEEYINMMKGNFEDGATIENIDYKDLTIGVENDSYVIISGHWLEEGTDQYGDPANYDNNNTFHVKKIDGKWLITKLETVSNE